MPENFVDAETFWKILKARIKELGMTQRELAERSGISQNTIEAQIFRKTIPRMSQIISMAKVLEVSPFFFATDIGTKEIKYDQIRKKSNSEVHEPNTAEYEFSVKDIPKEKLLNILLNEQRIEEDYRLLQFLKENQLDNESTLKNIFEEVLANKKRDL